MQSMIDVPSLNAQTQSMASITIRKFDDALKARLRVRAALRGRSMEDEAREILRSVLSRQTATPRNLASAVRQRFTDFGGVELESEPRRLPREPPRFDT